jgi:hypothetical protein
VGAQDVLREGGEDGVTLEERLCSDSPPRVIDSIDIELMMMMLARFSGPRDHQPPVQFIWYATPDDVPLEYIRWVTDEGERYYLFDEFVERFAHYLLGRR